MLGLVAIITSRTTPADTRVSNCGMVRSSGPMPSSGDRRPPRTGYTPRNSPDRSIAPISEASSTAQMTPVSLRASRQMEHKSSSVRLKHCGHGRTFTASVRRAVASRLDCSGDGLRRWYVSLSAVFRPMPGSLESSVARSSIAPTLERQLEWEVESPSELSHLALRELAGFFLGLVDGDEHQILQHLDVLGIRHARVDPDARARPLAVSFDRHQAAPGRSCHGLLFQLGLHLLHARLHLLRLLENLRKISHCPRL